MRIKSRKGETSIEKDGAIILAEAKHCY